MTVSAASADARLLMRGAASAALGTSFEGAPYVSLVLAASDVDASPLLMLSDLAQHTRNLAADDRVSLLYDATGGTADPLAGARLTVIGRVARCGDEGAMARYLARHPTAAAYAGFADFHLYRVRVERGHFVAGFGAISWVPAGALILADVAEMAEVEAGALEHMNRDHAEAVDLYARKLLGRDGEGWRMTGVDPDGCDLARGTRTARLDFPEPVFTAEALRARLAQLARDARA